jgi:hypothetical protein
VRPTKQGMNAVIYGNAYARHADPSCRRAVFTYKRTEKHVLRAHVVGRPGLSACRSAVSGCDVGARRGSGSYEDFYGH